MGCSCCTNYYAWYVIQFLEDISSTATLQISSINKVCMYVCMAVCMYVCKLCMYVCMSVCMYVVAKALVFQSKVHLMS